MRKSFLVRHAGAFLGLLVALGSLACSADLGDGEEGDEDPFAEETGASSDAMSVNDWGCPLGPYSARFRASPKVLAIYYDMRGPRGKARVDRVDVTMHLKTKAGGRMMHFEMHAVPAGKGAASWKPDDRL